jgi:acetyl esterase/lipase
MHYFQALRRSLLAAMTATVLLAAAPSAAFAAPMTWGQLSALPLPPVGEKIPYGNAPQQFGELRLPAGKAPKNGKFPVVVLVHGGCWQAEYDYVYFTHMAAALTDAGIATWTIEYRRIGDEGGGWPNTFLDVAKATDALRSIAKTYAIDPKRVVSMGHSAGGHLALWLAARHKLPKSSALYLSKPLALKGVVGLAAITDLAQYRVGEPDSCNASVDALMGGTDSAQPLRYAQGSPRALLPLGVPQWLVQGAADPIVPLASITAYADAANKAGDKVTVHVEEGLGHFDTVAPQTALGIAAINAAKALLLPAIASH